MRPRMVLLLVLTAFWAGSVVDGWALDRGLWDAYKDRFVSPDGRIIDRGNRQMSHSEGQGYGLILAVSADDRPSFERIRQWTRENLQVRGSDRLLAWSWGQRPNGEWAVVDLNNATDGDLLVLYGLLKAFERWNDPALRSKALELARDIKKHVVTDVQNVPVLLPGYYGFVDPNGFVLNLSYYVYPALHALARYDDDPIWNRLLEGGMDLLYRARRGPWNLPPDWILVNGEGLSVFQKRSSRFGYEAIRVPLYLAWMNRPKALQPWSLVLDWFDNTGSLPLWVDVVDPAVSLTEAPAGFYAVWAVAAQRLNRREAAEKLWNRAREKLEREKDDYYSATLYLLSLRALEGP